MRFMFTNTKRKNAPSFIEKQNRTVFLTMAAAEVVLLTLLMMLYLQLKTLTEPAILLSVMLVVLGVFTFAFTKSVSLTQSVLFISTLLLEFMLYSSLPVYEFGFSSFLLKATDIMPPVFVIADLFLVYWLFTQGLGVASKEEMAGENEPVSEDFPDPDLSDRMKR